jgi:beta-glucosidase
MHSRFFTLVLLVCSTSVAGGAPKQGILGHRSTPLLTVDGLTFKDLDRNGKLDPYEDWRLPAEVRVSDLVQHMSLEELAGLMVHGTLPSSGPLAPLETLTGLGGTVRCRLLALRRPPLGPL